MVRTSSDLADALLVMAESFLAGKVAGADDAEVYQVVLHCLANEKVREDRQAGRGAGVTADPQIPIPV